MSDLYHDLDFFHWKYKKKYCIHFNFEDKFGRIFDIFHIVYEKENVKLQEVFKMTRSITSCIVLEVNNL